MARKMEKTAPAADKGDERKARYKKYDEEQQFSSTEKAAYFLKIGLPVALGLVVIVGGGLLLIKGMGAGVAAGKATPAEENEADELLRDAFQAFQAGDYPVAESKLQRIKLKYGTTTVNSIAVEALERYKNGQPMFELNMVRSRSWATRPSAVTQTEGPAGRSQRADGASQAGSQASGEPQRAAENPLAVAERKERERAQALDAPANIEFTDAASGKPLPQGFVLEPGTRIHKSGWPAQIICIKDYSKMVYVPEGTFTIGRSGGPENEQPPREVTVRGFYIDRFEVTREMYVDKFLKANPDKPHPSPEGAAAMVSAKHPAVGITFADAEAYCAWAGKFLPTEAQWERAARGPANSRFPWGEDGSLRPSGRKAKTIEPITSHPIDRSGFAVLDMSGNAAEWCMDWYSDSYLGIAASDPAGPRQPASETNERVIRGGADDGSATWRGKMPEANSAPWLGFRGIMIPDVLPGWKPRPDDAAGSSKGSREPEARPEISRGARGVRKEGSRESNTQSPSRGQSKTRKEGSKQDGSPPPERGGSPDTEPVPKKI